MSRRKRRTHRKAFNHYIAIAFLFFGPLFGDAWGDELDSIRNIPASSPGEIVYAVDGGPDSALIENAAPQYFSYSPSPENKIPNGMNADEPWTWQMMPQGLIFRSYLAGGREPRFGSQFVHVKGKDWLWDASIGARIGLVRYGTQDPFAPQGWELDLEGAAFPRLTMDYYRDMVSADYRVGVPLTYRLNRWQYKFAFYHLSSHLADEYMVQNPDSERLNYSRDALTFGVGFFPQESWRLYAECGWAWYTDGGSQPWEFQFGVEYSPLHPNGFRGTPFFAINTRLREEVDYGGNMTVQAGWQWRGWSGQRFRVGLDYFNGMSDQYQFYREFEEQIGFGVWYDF